MTASLLKMLFFIIALVFIVACARQVIRHKGKLGNRVSSWAVVYSEKAPVNELTEFDMVILDADAHPSVPQIRATGTLALGYLSLMEIPEYRWYWPQVEGSDWLLEKNPVWGGHMADIRAHEWQDFMLDKIIPAILRKGFDGLFLDTADNAVYLERYRQGEKLQGCLTALTIFLQRLRSRYPDILLVMNRGFDVLPKSARILDGVVAESLFSHTDFESNTFRLHAPVASAEQIRLLQRIQANGISVFSLDYAPPDNNALIKGIRDRAQEAGFLPYISMPDLQKIYLPNQANQG